MFNRARVEGRSMSDISPKFQAVLEESWPFLGQQQKKNEMFDELRMFRLHEFCGMREIYA